MMTSEQYTKFKSGAKRHVGYKASMSPQQMVAQGRSKGFSYKRISLELNWASNIAEHEDPIKSARFREGAKLAESLENKNRIRA